MCVEVRGRKDERGVSGVRILCHARRCTNYRGSQLSREHACTAATRGELIADKRRGKDGTAVYITEDEQHTSAHTH